MTIKSNQWKSIANVHGSISIQVNGKFFLVVVLMVKIDEIECTKQEKKVDHDQDHLKQLERIVSPVNEQSIGKLEKKLSRQTVSFD